MRLTPFKVEHPQGAIGYRIDGPSASIAIVTDHEAGTGRDRVDTRAISGVDVLVHDAQYSPIEAEVRRGWGHSTWEGAIAAAEAAGVERLVLTSLDPRSTDDDVDAIVETSGTGSRTWKPPHPASRSRCEVRRHRPAAFGRWRSRSEPPRGSSCSTISPSSPPSR